MARSIMPELSATRRDIVRALEPGAVTVEADDDEMRIASGRSHFTVRTHPAGDFPRLPVPSGER